jgi:hypothetical protein
MLQVVETTVQQRLPKIDFPNSCNFSKENEKDFMTIATTTGW